MPYAPSPMTSSTWYALSTTKFSSRGSMDISSPSSSVMRWPKCRNSEVEYSRVSYRAAIAVDDGTIRDDAAAKRGSSTAGAVQWWESTRERKSDATNHHHRHHLVVVVLDDVPGSIILAGTNCSHAAVEHRPGKAVVLLLSSLTRPDPPA